MCPHVQCSQHGHRNALNQVCLPNTLGTGIFGRPDSASLPPSPILMYQRLTQEQGLGKSWGQLQHSHDWYCLPGVTVNRAQLSAQMAKDCRLLTMHLVLGTLGQSLRGDTEGTDFMWEHWQSLQLSERCTDIYIGISPASSCPKSSRLLTLWFKKKKSFHLPGGNSWTRLDSLWVPLSPVPTLWGLWAIFFWVCRAFLG